jgi:hypothetical protein
MEQKVDEQLKLVETKIQKEFGKNIFLYVDWNSTDSNNKDTNYKLIEPTVVKGIFGDSNSLIKWLKPSQRAFDIFLEKISNISISITKDFKQTKSVGSKNYQIDVIGDILHVQFMDGFVNYTDGWGLKVDVELGFYFNFH